MAAAAEEPIAGGRHKVFGHADLAVIPQTSTIASHLPRAVGVAFAIERARELGVPSRWPADAVVVCTFGDASLNHATAQAALNAAAHFAYQGRPLPILFVCEDNALGISVPTPEGWVEQSLHGRPELAYEQVAGDDAPATLAVATELAAWVREHRHPAVLHLRTVRFLSHAGADLETAYRSGSEIRADYDRDPLLALGRWLVAGGARTPDELADEYLETRSRHPRARPRGHGAAAARNRPGRDAAPRSTERRPRGGPRRVECRRAGSSRSRSRRRSMPRSRARSSSTPSRSSSARTSASRAASTASRAASRRGSAPHASSTRCSTRRRSSVSRSGRRSPGSFPIPEIQYLAYLHNAEDQLRGEAATLQFFSRGAYRNGMVVRIQGYGYQKGFGGHFHNDNGVGVLRDVPGLVIASPARPGDAAAMLTTCVAAAKADGSVCVFLEPIALYHTRDLHEEGDAIWLGSAAAEHVPVGAAFTHRGGGDLTIVTWGNGLYMSLRVARRLLQQGIGVSVVDLRWLAPLPLEEVLREATATGRTLVVDETRRTGGVGEGIVAELVDAGYAGRLARVSSKDSFVPLGDAARHVLLSEAEIESAAVRLLG